MPKPTIVLVVLIAIPVCMIIVTITVLSTDSSGRFVDWEHITEPHEPIVELLDHDNDGIYVQGRSGIIYRCDFCLNGNCDCWSDTDLPESLERDPGEIDPPSMVVADPPGDVKDRVSLGFQWQHGVRRTDYVVLQDGSLWRWDNITNGFAALGFLYLAVIGGLALDGLIVCVLIVGWLVRKVLARSHSR